MILSFGCFNLVLLKWTVTVITQFNIPVISCTDVPKDQQFYATQAAILLLPDENREALKMLLYFLRDVVACASENQMTQTNIAVCLAPSLFHLNSVRRESSSSTR